MANIRLVEFRDAAKLSELVRAFPTPTSAVALQAFFATCLSAKLSDPCSYLAVAEKGEILLGYISGYCHPAFYSGGNTGWVDEVFVGFDHRGQGIGRQLTDAFEAWAAQHGCVLVSLATAGARGFYESLGYTSKAGYYKKYISGS